MATARVTTAAIAEGWRRIGGAAPQEKETFSRTPSHFYDFDLSQLMGVEVGALRCADGEFLGLRVVVRYGNNKRKQTL